MIKVGGVEQLDPDEAYRRSQAGTPILDVREPAERRHAHVPGSLWVPLARLPREAADLPDDLIVMCAAGARSQQAARYLQAHGHQAANLANGIQGWARSGLPLETGEG